MRQERREYLYEGVVYPAVITFKRMRSLTLRYDPEKKTLRVSCPNGTLYRDIDAFVRKYLPKVTKKVLKKSNPYDGQTLYVLGEQKEVGEMEAEEITAYYKRIGLPYIQGRVAYYRDLMGVKLDYRVRMRDMKRTYGSNSKKTKTLTFQARLMAFHPDIVDSVVVHELAHHFQWDHSKKFYDVVYRYCPQYNALRKKLIHGQYEG